jgi:hypothetical protein
MAYINIAITVTAATTYVGKKFFSDGCFSTTHHLFNKRYTTTDISDPTVAPTKRSPG